MKTVVTFRLMNFDPDPEVVSLHLNIAGANIWRKGQLRSHSKHAHESNGWEYRVESLRGETLGVLVAKVLDAVSDGWERVVKFVPSYDAQMSCAIYLVGDERPEIQFDPESVRQLAALKASIDVDVYVSS